MPETAYPSASIPASVRAIATPSAPRQVAASRSSSPGRDGTRIGDTLLLQKGDAVVAMSLHDRSGKLQYIAPAGDQAVIDSSATYVAAIDENGIVVRRLRDRRVVAAVPRGDAIAFRSNGTALVSWRTRTPSHEADCHRPTLLDDVNLETGVRTPVYRSDDQLLPAAAAGSVALVHIPDEQCELVTTHRLELQTQRLTAYGAGSALVTSTPNLDRQWLSFPADAKHPYGHGRVVDQAGRTVAQVPYRGEAAFNNDGSLAYTEAVHGKPGTEEQYFTKYAYLRIGRAQPARTDKRTTLRNATNLVWDLRRGGLALRRSGGGDRFEAVYCSVPTLKCRALPLRWYDDVTLLRIVPRDTVAG